MKLQINQETKIKDVQKTFSGVYPFLKIEFYKNPHAEKKLSADEDKISADETLSEVGNFKKPETIDINKHRTVASLESEFYEKLGVAAQVSRRTGTIWIETSLTDERSLGLQNKQGKMASMLPEEDIIMEDDLQR